MDKCNFLDWIQVYSRKIIGTKKKPEKFISILKFDNLNIYNTF